MDDRILKAAAYCVTAYGVERVTLAEIARRARVSRPTVYRRWSDIRSVLAALLTARVVGALDADPIRGVGREAVVERVVAVADRLRNDEVVMSVLNRAPELTMVYTTELASPSALKPTSGLPSDFGSAKRAPFSAMSTGTIRCAGS